MADSHLRLVDSKCAKAPLDAHCMPEESFVLYKCENGYTPDEDEGELRVKCLYSYLWDTDPVCIKPGEGGGGGGDYIDDTPAPPPKTTTKAPTTTTTTKTTTQVTTATKTT